jgi:enamine deaminase RidA (YjgF/YER057c/UK114 family)
MPLIDTSYFVIQPDSDGDFKTDWQNCLGHLLKRAKDSRYRIFKLNIFVNSADFTDFRIKKRFVTDTLLDAFGEECPAFGILSISPEKPFNAAIEIGFVNSAGLKINYRKYKKWRYTLIEKNGYKELWVNGIACYRPCIRTQTASIKAFQIMRHILLAENMTFDNIIQQWNYIGRILYPGQQNFLFAQHYYIFNKVRFNYYSRYLVNSGFPAATGIGMKYKGVMIDFCAVAPNDDIQIISIKNPRQINPYDYDQKVMVASILQGQKRFPLFDRAKLLICQDKLRLFVSGTASIIGQETVGKEDVQKQTMITIENIETLTNNENLLRHCQQINLKKPDKYKRIRVYVKNASDIPLVKLICTNHFGNIPAIYVQSDICRTDLLVEIETELQS